jgi:hypothetical protein
VIVVGVQLLKPWRMSAHDRVVLYGEVAQRDAFVTVDAAPCAIGVSEDRWSPDFFEAFL